jgi:hypothetical protein
MTDNMEFEFPTPLREDSQEELAIRLNHPAVYFPTNAA